MDVSEATVGYELDSITLRDIASVRYVRQHEWLDHLLGSPLPTSAIIPPKITKALNSEEIESRMKELETEVAKLEAEKQAGWKFHLDEERARVMSRVIHDLRENFGAGSAEHSQKSVEDLLGVKLINAETLRPVEATYDRQAVEREQARLAQEHQREKAMDVEKDSGADQKTSSQSQSQVHSPEQGENRYAGSNKSSTSPAANDIESTMNVDV